MSKMVYPCLPELADSTVPFQTPIQNLVIPDMGSVYDLWIDNSTLGVQVPYLFPWTRSLMINSREFCVLIGPQPNGGFVARTSTPKFNATGQGRTEEEALQDIKDAIELLIEEESNPSGDAPWPEDCR